jgi:hypothetical protein
MSAHMATATYMDTGQAIAYLFVLLIPLLRHYLASVLLQLSPIDRCALAKLFWASLLPGLRGRLHSLPPPRGRGLRNWLMQTCNRKRIVSVRRDSKQQQHKWRWRSYLFSFL